MPCLEPGCPRDPGWEGGWAGPSGQGVPGEASCHSWQMAGGCRPCREPSWSLWTCSCSAPPQAPLSPTALLLAQCQPFPVPSSPRGSPSSELLHPYNYAWPYFPRQMWRNSLTKDPWATSRCQRQPGRCSLDAQVFKVSGTVTVFQEDYFYFIHKSKPS